MKTIHEQKKLKNKKICGKKSRFNYFNSVNFICKHCIPFHSNQFILYNEKSIKKHNLVKANDYAVDYDSLL